MSHSDVAEAVAEVKEAIEWFDSLAPWQLDAPNQHVLTAFDAARRWVRVVETGEQVECMECSGKGKVGPIPTGNDTWTFATCEVCGGSGRFLLVAAVGVEKETSDE